MNHCADFQHGRCSSRRALPSLKTPWSSRWTPALACSAVAVITTIDTTTEGDTFAPELGYDWTMGASLPADGWQSAENGTGYQYPPLVGPESYNNGAGMTRVLTAAAFVRHNMPFGVTFDTPVLSDADAYDVAAYMNSLERPTRPNLDIDFPNKLQKPVDTPYGPYADGFPPEQHRYGPFDPIRAKVRELAAARR